MEIALKIANKIKANERFSAYIVIPMRPEGDPTDPIFYQTTIQQILYWQVNHMIISIFFSSHLTNQLSDLQINMSKLLSFLTAAA
jgi:hypothetical protein